MTMVAAVGRRWAGTTEAAQAGLVARIHLHLHLGGLGIWGLGVGGLGFGGLSLGGLSFGGLGNLVEEKWAIGYWCRPLS